MKKVETDIVVVIPIGPDSRVEFILDTIAGFRFYSRSSYQIILADDSGQYTGGAVANVVGCCHVLVNKKPLGGWAGLYITLASAYRYAVKNYTFKALLKLDTDALVIGTGAEQEVIELFSNNAGAGMAGQYPNTYAGEPWNIKWPQRRILNSTRTWKFIRRPAANLLLIKFHNRALRNGYRTGESVFGGAYFFSEGCLNQLMADGVLPAYTFRALNLGEDHLFSLLVKAAGFSLESLSDNNGPIACDWQGLPASPQELKDKGVKIIHSVRCWADMDEAAIRTFFCQKRLEEQYAHI